MDDAPPLLELSAARRIPTTPERVWAGLTQADRLASWWSPPDLETKVRRLDARPGGVVELHVRYVPALWTATAGEAFRAAGVPISFDLRGTFREFRPPRRIVFDLTLDLGRHGAGVAMQTCFELVDERGGTRVTVTGAGASTPHWTTLGRQNLEAQLERLDRAVTAADVPPSGSGPAMPESAGVPARPERPPARNRGIK
jgi:uncharacterized protein YndB with AHSA1/START domain